MSLLRVLFVIGLLLIGGSVGNSVRATTLDVTQLAGQWAGALPIPGGSRQLSITVTATPDGIMSAVLRVSAPNLNNSPMRVLQVADSVVFFADKVGCRFAGLPTDGGQRLRGQWQQPGYRTTLVLERMTTPTGMAAGLIIEEVRISSSSSQNSEIGLGGTLTWPAGAGPFPAVVLLADAGATKGAGTDQLLTSILTTLTRQGVAVLRLDDRGLGRSAAIPAATSSAELAADAYSALSFLRTRPGIDPMRVGLLGHGEGANIALLAATQAPAPAFLVALGAAGLSGQELLARQTALVNRPGEPDTAQLAWARKEAHGLLQARREAKQQLAAGATPAQAQLIIGKEKMRLSTEARKRNEALYKRQYAMLEIIRQMPDNAQAQTIVANMLKQIYPTLPAAVAQERAGQLTSPWYRSFLIFNPQAELTKISCPALLLHGSADAQVSAAVNVPLLEKGLKANKRVSVQKLEGVNHEFEAPAGEQVLAANSGQPHAVSDEALDTIREWVVQRVKP